MADVMERRGALAGRTRRSAGVSLIVAALGLAACSGVASPSPSVLRSTEPTPAPAATPAPSVTIAPTRTAGPTATPGLETRTETDVAFGSDPLMAPGVVDVFAPVAPGPWPVAVMFHGGGMTKSYFSPHAKKLAESGYVVFVPNWGVSGGAAYDALLPHEQVEAEQAQMACAIAFAAQEAPRYGGDPTWLTVFGHSAGASEASVVAFEPPEPSAGCLADTRADADVLIAWDGDWLMAGTPSFWDPIQAADPATFDAITPWTHIAGRPDLRVIILQPGDDTKGRSAGDALGPDGWLTVRDPTGAFTAAFQAMGAFDDDYLALNEWQKLLANRLAESGNLVSYDIMPGSNHESLSDAGWVVFLDAFKRAAALAD